MRQTIHFIIIKCQSSIHALRYDFFILNKKKKKKDTAAISGLSDHKRSTLSQRLSQVIMAGIYLSRELDEPIHVTCIGSKVQIQVSIERPELAQNFQDLVNSPSEVVFL